MVRRIFVFGAFVMPCGAWLALNCVLFRVPRLREAVPGVGVGLASSVVPVGVCFGLMRLLGVAVARTAGGSVGVGVVITPTGTPV